MAGMTRETADQLKHLLRPLATRIVNSIARGVVNLANDTKKLQVLQLGVLAGETVDKAEHHQPYGFYSVPLAGAEAILLFPNGDRSHPIVVAASDRRYRPTGGEPGQVGFYHYMGAKVTMLANGDIEIQPGPGGQVFVRDAGGTAEPLVKKSEFDAHTHDGGSMAAGGDPVTGTSAGAAAVTGTQRMRAQ